MAVQRLRRAANGEFVWSDGVDSGGGGSVWSGDSSSGTDNVGADSSSGDLDGVASARVELASWVVPSAENALPAQSADPWLDSSTNPDAKDSAAGQGLASAGGLPLHPLHSGRGFSLLGHASVLPP